MKSHRVSARRCLEFIFAFLLATVLVCFIESLLYVSDGATIYQKVFLKAPVEILQKQNLRNNIKCYRSEHESLPDITNSTPRKNKSIFFHQTSCTSFYKKKIVINAREACAVESAAKMNPNLDIYLLYSSPGIFKYDGEESDDLLEAVLSYRNVKVMHLDFEKHIKGTDLEDLYSSGKIEESHYAVSHASDILRYLTLWKYGGIYLDLDMMVIKSLENVPLNFAGVESNLSVNSAALSFEATRSGHNLVEKCLTDLKNNFNGLMWANNGPGVITRLLKSICGVDRVEEMPNKNCQGFTVYPEYRFYPIPGPSWEMYFNETFLADVIEATKHSYAIHMWNNNSAKRKLPITSNAPYLYFARKYCPKVVEICKNSF